MSELLLVRKAIKSNYGPINFAYLRCCVAALSSKAILCPLLISKWLPVERSKRCSICKPLAQFRRTPCRDRQRINVWARLGRARLELSLSRSQRLPQTPEIKLQKRFKSNRTLSFYLLLPVQLVTKSNENGDHSSQDAASSECDESIRNNMWIQFGELQILIV